MLKLLLESSNTRLYARNAAELLHSGGLLLTSSLALRSAPSALHRCGRLQRPQGLVAN